MSRHAYKTCDEAGALTMVLMGWDRPLQGYFMVISKPGEDQDEPFYSNIFDKESHPKTVQPFLEILENYKISIPQEMINAVIEDGVNNIGNKDVTHYFDENRYYCVGYLDRDMQVLIG